MYSLNTAYEELRYNLFDEIKEPPLQPPSQKFETFGINGSARGWTGVSDRFRIRTNPCETLGGHVHPSPPRVKKVSPKTLGPLGPLSTKTKRTLITQNEQEEGSGPRRWTCIHSTLYCQVTVLQNAKRRFCCLISVQNNSDHLLNLRGTKLLQR